MPGTPVEILAAKPIGALITFRSKNGTDQILWRGRIEGFVTAGIAQTYTDLVSYNAAVRLSDPAVSNDLSALNFFLLTLDNPTGPVQHYAFASEWILNGTLDIIDQKVKVHVVVYDVSTADHLPILTVLRAGGYSCYVESVSS